MSSIELVTQDTIGAEVFERVAPPGVSRYPKRITVRVDERILFVRTEDVEWFEGARNYVRVHVGPQVYRIRMSLRALEEVLDPDRFRRIHRSIIVNLDHVREIQPWFSGDYVALLRDRRQLRVSRTFAQELLRPLQ
ncbi:MAG TPA: LytTR family DNA-binding domain-containing protein [Gemmatimonadaceae bacterium]